MLSSSALSLDLIPDLRPHKIFLWDKGGQYIDYSFPNPVFGHFEDPTQLKGANVLEVLPGESGQAVLENIRHTLISQEPQFLSIELQKRNGRSFMALIRLFPLAMHVLGLVNDFPNLDIPTSLQPSRDPLSSSQPTPPKSKHPLTYREQYILRMVGENLSNEAIATQLYISQRTVKFHLLNIYKKIGVSARISLQTLAPFLIQTFHGSPHHAPSP